MLSLRVAVSVPGFTSGLSRCIGEAERSCLDERVPLPGAGVSSDEVGNEFLDAVIDLVSDWADLIDREACRVVEVPVEVSLARGRSGRRRPQPIVITTSAPWTTSAVRGLGNSLEKSSPISFMPSMTAGLTSLAGVEPAERT